MTRTLKPTQETPMPIKPAAPSFRTEHHLPFEVVCEAVRLWVEKHHVAL